MIRRLIKNRKIMYIKNFIGSKIIFMGYIEEIVER